MGSEELKYFYPSSTGVWIDDVGVWFHFHSLPLSMKTAKNKGILAEYSL